MATRDARTAPFFEAAHAQDLDRLRALLDSDPGLVMEPDPECFGYRLLNLAAGKGNRALADLALDRGADPDASDAFDFSPVLHAVNYGHHDLARHLVERGASLGVHEAAGLGRLDVLEEMLEKRPPAVHDRGGDGCTPLHFALNPATAAFLVDRGAKVDARDQDHHSTPAQWAASGRPEVARFLVECGAEPDIFMVALSGDAVWMSDYLAGHPDAIDDRVDQKRFPPPPDRPDTHTIYTFGVGKNATALHAAVMADATQVVVTLVGAGLDPHVRGGYDDATPLHVAAWWDRPEVARQLLAFGADIDADSGPAHENGPLGWAIVAGSQKTVEVLLEHDAPIRDYYEAEVDRAIAGEFKTFATWDVDRYQAIGRLIRDHRRRRR